MLGVRVPGAIAGLVREIEGHPEAAIAGAQSRIRPVRMTDRSGDARAELIERTGDLVRVGPFFEGEDRHMADHSGRLPGIELALHLFDRAHELTDAATKFRGDPTWIHVIQSPRSLEDGAAHQTVRNSDRSKAIAAGRSPRSERRRKVRE